jgi:hypothetical protein
MVSRIKKVVLSVVAAISLAVPMAVPVAVSAQADINSNLCAGINLSTTTCDAQTEGSNGATKINTLIATVINIFSLVVGIVAVIMIIIGGLKYITSGGDSGNVTGAKNTILYAVIGLVVVALAQFIVKFVLGKATA